MMDIIKRRYRNKKVHANIVYNEYIQDRDHTHMNSTKWVTLTGFVTYLGKTGKCKVEETAKGWYVTYIEKDPEELAKQKKEKMDLDDEERMKKEIEKKVKKAHKAAENKKPEFTELQRDENGDTKIEFSLTTEKIESESTESFDLKKSKPLKFNWSVDEDFQEADREEAKKKTSALDAIMIEEEKKKDVLNRKDFWIVEDIVVKVMNHDLADGKYYKEKGNFFTTI
jgi:DNA/RNA-binding protein KIN17